jgi:hypothetical protein
MRVIAFRTENGCGWGVKALEKIKERISALLILYFIQQSTLRFHSVGGCRTVATFGMQWQSDALTTRLDLIITCTVHIFTNICPRTSVACIFVSKN